MPGDTVFSGPAQPAGREFCLLCAASWKAEAISAAREQGMDLDGPLDLAALMAGQPDPELAVATTTMVLPVPVAAGASAGQPMVVTGPACWTHLQPIRVVDSQLAIAGPGNPFAGAADLSKLRG
jgi:hypothetical protein